jgi:hydroxypyruvate isomerase
MRSGPAAQRSAWVGEFDSQGVLMLMEENAPIESATGHRLKGRVRQTFVYWCFEKHWSLDRACQVARQLGCLGIESVPSEEWPTLKKHGILSTLAKAHHFDLGPNNPRSWPLCLERLRASIDACADFGCPNAVTFTGTRDGTPDDVGLRNCVEGYKQIVGYAERKKVTLCLEMLNSRTGGNMLGRPDYQGDHADYCLEIIKRVGSPRLKLLFDIYHVQIMDGDLISRIRADHEFIGHYHTAGVPGRCELDNTQEINFPPIMKAILETGYTGYVGHEFIPTRDPFEGLREAVTLCDV